MRQRLAMATSPRVRMAGGGNHPGANKRKREAAGRPKGGADATKRKKPYEAPAPRKDQPVTAKDKRVAAKEMSESRKMKRKPNYNLEKELAVPREKMRCHDVSKEDISYNVNYNFDLW